jgi:hypothetical protein
MSRVVACLLGVDAPEDAERGGLWKTKAKGSQSQPTASVRGVQHDKSTEIMKDQTEEITTVIKRKRRIKTNIWGDDGAVGTGESLKAIPTPSRLARAYVGTDR